MSPRSPRLEALEDRTMPAWAGVAPALLPPGGNRFLLRPDADASFRAAGRISRGEVDSFRFTALRSGVYTIRAEALENVSQLDPVVGLYSPITRRLGSNDDAGPETNDSLLTISLSAGQRYRVAVTNRLGAAVGQYTIEVAAPTLLSQDSTSELLGAVGSSGSATLTGAALTLSLDGFTTTPADATTHFLDVVFRDFRGRSLGIDIPEQSLTTGGESPASDSNTWSLDLSDVNLSRVGRITVLLRNQIE